MTTAQDSNQLLIFRIRDIRFALNIEDTLEVSLYPRITPIYCGGPLLLGVANIRGYVVPIIDVWQMLCSDTESVDVDKTEVVAAQKHVLIVNLNSERVGLVVNEIDGIGTVEVDGLTDASEMLHGINPKYYSNIYKDDNGLLALLRLEGFLFGDDDLISTHLGAEHGSR